MSSYSFSMSTYSSLSSWSDLPIDILLRIKDKVELHNPLDLLSFRTACSHWRSIVPIPNHLPRYKISIGPHNNIYFTKFKSFLDNERNMNISRSISLPFLTSSQISYFCSSNGWLVFLTPNHRSIFLFNPVLNRQLIFPPLSYHELKPTHHNISQLIIRKVVVSSSTSTGVVVACIAEIFYENPYIIDKRFVVCRHGKGQKWRTFTKISKGIIDIILAGNGHIYALHKLKLYMLDETLPNIKLVGFRLWFPKQILKDDGEDDSVEKRLCVNGCRMEVGRESELNIYVKIHALGWRSWSAPNWITLNFDVAKICRNNIGVVDVACKAEFTDHFNTSWSCGDYYSPLQRDISLTVEEQSKLYNLREI